MRTYCEIQAALGEQPDLRSEQVCQRADAGTARGVPFWIPASGGLYLDLAAEVVQRALTVGGPVGLRGVTDCATGLDVRLQPVAVDGGELFPAVARRVSWVGWACRRAAAQAAAAVPAEELKLGWGLTSRTSELLRQWNRHQLLAEHASHISFLAEGASLKTPGGSVGPIPLSPLRPARQA